MYFGRVLALLAAFAPIPALSEGERAGDFDYYVLALSWSPNWCAIEGDDRNSPQCDDREDFGWVMHGLWPQFERGWPSNCRTTERNPSRADTAAMADIMGTSGLAWYQWNKHGKCAGLSAGDYFDTAREAYENVKRPDVFRKLNKTVAIPARVIEEAFLQDNPLLEPDMITVTCKVDDGKTYIQEARICLNKDLSPRYCGTDTVRDCKATGTFTPVR